MSHTRQYEYDNIEIIVNEKLKNTYLSIDKDKKIVIKTPYKSQSFVDSLLEERKAWIYKQLAKIEKCIPLNEEEISSLDEIQDKLVYYSQEMNLEYEKLSFRKMKSRWGSCNSRREITLNKQLSFVNRELVDYVVVHELAHLQHMNHSKAFHSLVESYLPNSKHYRQELKNIRLS